MKPTRPLLRYHGGKWRLAPFVLAHFPKHRTYVEPFGGAASVLLQKERSYAEVYNDLDEELVGLFRILRDPEQADRLRDVVELTPCARAEFLAAYELTDEPIERARRLLVRSWMGQGTCGVKRLRTGFRIDTTREGGTPADNWSAFPEILPAIVARLRGVYIECRPASQIIERFDGPETLHYLDPPYLSECRSQIRVGDSLYHGYRHELDDTGHDALLAQIVGLKGMVVLSGYASPRYDAALPGWIKATTEAFADRAQARTEVLWLNPAAAERLRPDEPSEPQMVQAEMFAEAAE